MLHYLFCWSDHSKFGHWSLFQVSFCILLTGSLLLRRLGGCTFLPSGTVHVIFTQTKQKVSSKRLSLVKCLLFSSSVDILFFFFPYSYHPTIMIIPDYTERSSHRKYTKKGKRVRPRHMGFGSLLLPLLMVLGKLTNHSKSQFTHL